MTPEEKRRRKDELSHALWESMREAKSSVTEERDRRKRQRRWELIRWWAEVLIVPIIVGLILGIVLAR